MEAYIMDKYAIRRCMPSVILKKDRETKMLFEHIDQIVIHSACKTYRFPTVVCLNYFSFLNPVLSLYRKNPRVPWPIPKTVIKMEFRYVIVLVRNDSS